MTTFETVAYEASGGLARLTLNRPDERNAMTNRMEAFRAFVEKRKPRFS